MPTDTEILDWLAKDHHRLNYLYWRMENEGVPFRDAAAFLMHIESPPREITAEDVQEMVDASIKEFGKMKWTDITADLLGFARGVRPKAPQKQYDHWLERGYA